LSVRCSPLFLSPLPTARPEAQRTQSLHTRLGVHGRQLVFPDVLTDFRYLIKPGKNCHDIQTGARVTRGIRVRFCPTMVYNKLSITRPLIRTLTRRVFTPLFSPFLRASHSKCPHRKKASSSGRGTLLPSPYTFSQRLNLPFCPVFVYLRVSAYPTLSILILHTDKPFLFTTGGPAATWSPLTHGPSSLQFRFTSFPPVFPPETSKSENIPVFLFAIVFPPPSGDLNLPFAGSPPIYTVLPIFLPADYGSPHPEWRLPENSAGS